jgi:hypothetical protein
LKIEAASTPDKSTGVLLAIQYQELANRLRAFQPGSGPSADENIRRGRISLTALQSFENSGLAEMAVLEKLSGAPSLASRSSQFPPVSRRKVKEAHP